MGGIPDRWLNYHAVGKRIFGTRFIAFKVPLKETLQRSIPEREKFTPSMLVEEVPDLSLVVDLTNTLRYYDKAVFESRNIQYVKIKCPGHVVPPKHAVQRFFKVVDDFLEQNPDGDTAIGVHCTHGINRTGYFICKYMIERLAMDPAESINAFGTARGYPIERTNYTNDLQGLPQETSGEVPEGAAHPGAPRDRPHGYHGYQNYDDQNGYGAPHHRGVHTQRGRGYGPQSHHGWGRHGHGPHRHHDDRSRQDWNRGYWPQPAQQDHRPKADRVDRAAPRADLRAAPYHKPDSGNRKSRSQEPRAQSAEAKDSDSRDNRPSGGGKGKKNKNKNKKKNKNKGRSKDRSKDRAEQR